MKQLLQSLRDGSTKIIEAPVSSPKTGNILIKTLYSLVSSGTEKTLVDFGKANLIDKAKQQPDKVKDVLNKIKTDGINSTYEAIVSKLDKPIPLGYCNVGVVEETGESVEEFKKGDLVVSNGSHAEFVTVPKNLCAFLPNSIPPQYGTFVPLASIGLQGVRLLKPELGETILVSGLGLIGQLTCQILKNNGCNVLGVDPDEGRCNLAKSFGVDVFKLSETNNPLSWTMQKTKNIGVDGVIITAATNSSEPIHQAAEACRKRGRIIMVGVTGINLRRDLFYKKELSFQVSCSYGPGRYDNFYEQEGNDYPIGFVRWTEKRNFESVINLIGQNKIDLEKLITHEFEFQNANKAYELLSSPENNLGIILSYENLKHKIQNEIEITNLNEELTFKENTGLGLIGAGEYANRILLSAFSKAGADFRTIVSNDGVAPAYLGRKYKFQKASTKFNSIIDDDLCNSVLITTRHDSHAELVKKSLISGKNVFVEKPLCLNQRELDEIKSIHKENQILMIGFNRRFAPLIINLKEKLSKINGKKAFIYTCNAGKLQSNHWLKDQKAGGGRLIGEACHFIDLLIFLSGSLIQDASYFFIEGEGLSKDTFSINLKFEDGSIGTVNYLENGSRDYPKERIEVFSEGNIFRLDNFNKLKYWGNMGFKNIRKFTQDKGHINCAKAFLRSINNGKPSPIPFNEICNTHEVIFNLLKSN